ncbi:hypothetical protein J4414_01945 [Candidatus Woesearchaeota archaeon]|nr:hypothetical protein [Candidatus Woesearchaeota archaeon]
MKKGVSPLIAWILIIGLTVSLALIVGNFLKESAETTKESLIEYVEGGSTCDKIIINAEPLECNKASRNIKLKINNRGFLAINKIQVRIFYSDNTLGNEIVSFNNNLLPDNNIEAVVPIENKAIIKLQAVPIREETGCADKKAELSQEETQWFVGGC